MIRRELTSPDVAIALASMTVPIFRFPNLRKLEDVADDDLEMQFVQQLLGVL